jgi:hypothetical protein
MVKVAIFVIAVMLALGSGLYYLSLKSNLNNQSNQKTVQQNQINIETNADISPTPVIITSKSGLLNTNQIKLSVLSPTDGTTLNSSTILVNGETAPGAEVSVNDIDTKADSDGNFKANISLEEGDNYIVVVATDDLGNYAEKEINITFDTGNE